MAEPEPHSAQGEHRHHRYVTNEIPWFVHLIWVGFWILAVYYTVRWILPMMQLEIRNPP